MTKFLITGASGFVGANFVRALVKKENDVTVFLRNNSNLWRIIDILPQVNVKIIDMKNINEIKTSLNEINPEYIFHFAVYGSHPFQKDVSDIFQTNIVNSFNLMFSAVNVCDHLKRFINIGASTEYGPKLKPMKEDDFTEPITFEGISKSMQTNLVQFFAKNLKLPILTLRLFSVYGHYEQPGRLISDIITAIIKNRILKLSTPLPRRDFIFIDDVISALEKAYKTPNIDGHIFNIGSGEDHSVGDVVDLIFKLTKKKTEISWGHEDKKREFDKMTPWIANIEKTKQLLKWKPNFSFKEGLMQTYEWYLNNQQIWDKNPITVNP